MVRTLILPHASLKPTFSPLNAQINERAVNQIVKNVFGVLRGRAHTQIQHTLINNSNKSDNCITCHQQLLFYAKLTN